jgi:hypothetical protein
MSRIILFSVFCLALAGCSLNSGSQKVATSGNEPQTTIGTINKCVPGAADLEGYGDKGKRLASCFVEYPGEPSRQDKSYYIVEDICGQFTQEFMENILGQKLVKIVASPIPTLYNCSYYLDDKQYVMLVLDYLSVANQKKGREYMGQAIKTDSRIPMENFYAIQADGPINTIYLILNQSKFISIERSSAQVLAGDSELQFAAKLANEIKNYK